MARQTPQEKKALSYARDRRNAYSANDKASRKAIPLRKRLTNRANRHQDRQLLSDATGRPNVDVADATEQRVKGRRPKSWRKWPDVPLREHLARQLGRRARRENRRAR